MRVLLDTNIVIHRENNIVSNYSIGHLFRWLDKLKYDKIIHPYTIDEINKLQDPLRKEVLAIKLNSYEVLKTVINPSDDFLSKLARYKMTENDAVDNTFLFESYAGRVDLLITEDRKMLTKAKVLGIQDKVFSINGFITLISAKFPALIDYKILAVSKEYFGNIEIGSNFFDSFRRDYNEFDRWFLKKCDEEAYICRDGNLLLGFLYLKPEGDNENYSDITPRFDKAKRLKIGTFKVESTGFRLGERFIKIIFDNAIQYDVEEVYVTLFEDREELKALYELLKRWGFIRYGIKHSENGEETVLVKRMKEYRMKLSIKQNYPNMLYNRQKFILPIQDCYHTDLLPDSKLKTENEENFVDLLAHRYALQKVYISWSRERNIEPGDLILFYRMGGDGTNKKYTSVITTLGIVDHIVYNFDSKDEYLKHCQNRSVFSDTDLNKFWESHRYSLMILKFIYVKSLSKRLTLEYLWNNDIITFPNGPRPFSRITNGQFNQILKDSQTEIDFYE